MNTPSDAIAFTAITSKNFIDALTADLKGNNWFHRPCPNANCAAWIVGHLILTDRRALTVIGANLPTLPDGFEIRFGRDNDAPAAHDFGDTSILIPLFDQQRTAFADNVKKLQPADLNKLVEKPSPRFKTVGEMLLIVGGTHPMLHAGQLSTIRRSLGRPPLF